MLDLFKKSLLAGLGASVISKEKAEQVIQELVEQGKIKAEDSKDLVDQLLDSGTQQWEEVQAALDEAIHKALAGVDVARGSRLDDLARRVDSLEQRLKILEDLQ